VSNRIAKGVFKLNGQEFSLEKNNGNNNLHSGSTGLHTVCFILNGKTGNPNKKVGNPNKTVFVGIVD
jgi:galactose mutarotase-like enzyme